MQMTFGIKLLSLLRWSRSKLLGHLRRGNLLFVKEWFEELLLRNHRWERGLDVGYVFRERCGVRRRRR